jgi:p-aminobenzoyl-glutamate transporter AbgT
MMRGILVFILILVGWFVLNRYLLPKLGIDT